MKKQIIFTIIIFFTCLFNLFSQTQEIHSLNGTWKMTWTDRVICDVCFKMI